MLLENNNVLFFTSFIFIINTLAALYKKYYFYSFLFFCLTITSLQYHSTHTMYANIIDKIVIAGIVLYGGYMLYKKSDKSISINIFIIITFLACVFLYIYGCFTNNYCFHPDAIVANNYHALMHIVGSIGHNLIILL
jgi:hypothetical protein